MTNGRRRLPPTAGGTIGSVACSSASVHSIGAIGWASARASTSSTWLTGMISSASFTDRRNLGQVLFILRRDQHRANSAAQRRQQLFLEAADRQAPGRASVTSPVIAMSRRTGIAGQRRDHRRDHADARRRPVLGHRAFGQVDVDVLAREDRRLDAVARARAP